MGRTLPPPWWLNVDRDRLEAELIRALECVNEIEKTAPQGVARQWAQLAKVRVKAAMAALGMEET